MLTSLPLTINPLRKYERLDLLALLEGLGVPDCACATCIQKLGGFKGTAEGGGFGCAEK